MARVPEAAADAQDFTARADADERWRRLQRIAWWLDNSIPVPGTSYRIGFDAIIGLVPGFGDLAGLLLSGYILSEALHRGVPRTVLARMALNVAVETVVGAVPLLGDVFDAAWKANQRNVNLLGEYLERPQPVRRRSGLIVAAAVLAVLAAAFAVLVVIAAVLRWAFTTVF